MKETLEDKKEDVTRRYVKQLREYVQNDMNPVNRPSPEQVRVTHAYMQHNNRNIYTDQA